MLLMEELTQDELYFLQRFRSLNDHAKEAVAYYLRVSYLQCCDDNTIPSQVYTDESFKN